MLTIFFSRYNGTAMAPTGTAVGTASASVSGAGGSQSTGGSAPIDNAAAANSFASSALGLVIAGGVALAL